MSRHNEVDRLESDNTLKKWTIEELKEIRDTYRAKTKKLIEESKHGKSAAAI
jgi:hypothetical protein